MPEETRVPTASMEYRSLVEDWPAIEKARQVTRAESGTLGKNASPQAHKNGIRKKNNSRHPKSKR